MNPLSGSQQPSLAHSAHKSAWLSTQTKVGAAVPEGWADEALLGTPEGDAVGVAVGTVVGTTGAAVAPSWVGADVVGVLVGADVVGALVGAKVSESEQLLQESLHVSFTPSTLEHRLGFLSK